MANYVKGTVTKDPNKVLDTLSGNATVDASPKGGVAAVAKGTDGQSAMEQLNNYYRQQAAKEQSDLAYADYLTDGKVSQDLKYGNYLTNGRFSGYNSYAEYLASIGQTPQDSQKVRDASVAQANTAYERSLASYGQKGEQLARSGLSNTGYSDASNNAAYAAKQNAILQADATKAATDQSNRLGYAQYLQTYDAQQQSKMMSVLEYTTQAGMTAEQAKAYAKAVGFDDTVAESIGKAQAAYTEATSGTATKATDLYNTLVSNENFAYDPATKNSLRQQLLNSGYDEATVDDVLGRLDKSYTTAQGDSYELLLKGLTDNTAFSQIGAGIDGWDKMTDAEKNEAYNKLIASSSGLTDEQKEKILSENIKAMVSAGKEGDDILDELYSYRSIGLSESIYQKIVKDVASTITINNYKPALRYGKDSAASLTIMGTTVDVNLKMTDKAVKMSFSKDYQEGDAVLYGQYLYIKNSNGTYQKYSVSADTSEMTNQLKELLGLVSDEVGVRKNRSSSHGRF